MADAFMAAIFGADKVKATARFKDTSKGIMKTVMLNSMPTDMSEAAFMEAAKGGVDASAKAIGKDADRSRNVSGKGIFGAAAMSATANVLGFTVPEPTATEVADAVPEPVKARAKSGTLNGVKS